MCVCVYVGWSDYEEMAVRSPFQTPESTTLLCMCVCVCLCVSGDHAHAAISHSSARLSLPLLKCQSDVPWTRREDVTAGCSPAVCVSAHWLLLTDPVPLMQAVADR